jgi:NADPH:quinone reductase-like Zn-dependent oxidoreductase
VQAIVQDVYGSPDVLHLSEIDRPVVGGGDVLVGVRAAGVDPSVWHLTTGRPYVARLMGLGLRRPRSRVRGWDLAGVVEAVGPDVTRFKPGDEVLGSGAGAFAEYANAPESKLVAKPADLTFEQAAVIPVSGCTALQAVRDRGKVQPGQRVAVIGAAGGVGTYAVQIAKALGAEVTGVCSTTKLDLVRSIGADHVVDYTAEDFADGTRRYDLIVETAGRLPFHRLRRCLNPGGTLVMVGGDEGGPLIDGIGRLALARLVGPFVGRKLVGFLAQIKTEDLENLLELVASGKLTPVMGTKFPLAEAPEAVRRLKTEHSRGKAVIVV